MTSTSFVWAKSGLFIPCMPKRQVVPAALREELTEYSSLLRALRTQHTLDVTAHLTQSQPSSEEPQSVASSANLKRKRSSTPVDDSQNNWRLRDQWTRWPLPVDDVPPPDWTLQDEVASIVKQVLDTLDGSDSDSEGHESEDDGEEEESGMAEDEDEDEDAHRLAELLTPVVEDTLVSFFALISAHTISRVDSLQNRIEPFSLHDFINMLASPAASHLVDETMLQNLTTRINSIPDLPSVSTSTSIPAPAFDKALHRHRLAASSRSRINELMSRPTASIFQHPFPPTGYKYKGIRQIRAQEKINAENKKERRSKKATQSSRESTTEEQTHEDHMTEDIDIQARSDDDDDDDGDGDNDEQLQTPEEDGSDSEETTSASDDEG